MPTATARGIDYHALIRAYKVIRQFKLLDPEETSEELVCNFEKWMNDEKNYAEKCIAEMVVLDEMLYRFCYGSEINKQVGFELVPAREHL